MSHPRPWALLAGASLAAIAAGPALAGPVIADEDAAEAQNPAVKALVVKAARQQTPATAEATTAEEIRETINAVNAEDVVKYLPSLFARKRHIGDTQAPLATRTNGGGASARTLIYADGVLLSALIGNNNSTASPRWGMVAPDEIASVDFLYGPFSAAYAGNSIGGVLNIRTLTPETLEGSIHAAGAWQNFAQYGTDDDYRAGQLSASLGDRIGDFWFRISGNIVDSKSQPLAYVTAARPATASAAGTPVTGAFTDVNRTNAPIAVFGAGGLEHQVQTNLKLKLGYDLPFASANYFVGRFGNNTDASAETYVRDASGTPFYAGTANVGGYAYTLAASAFANNVYARDDAHWMQGLSLASRGDGPWTWKLAASRYDYAKDQQRTPSTALPGALAGGAGTISRMDGTGWRTLDAQAGRGFARNALSFGVHADAVELASVRHNTTDWISGPAGALIQEARGKTRTEAAWVQDKVELGDALSLTLGARYERWRATDGYNYAAAPAPGFTFIQPARSDTAISPKATLRWSPAAHWGLTASYGEAHRFPTVTELYQSISTGTVLTSPNPDLRPEHARSAELAAEYSDANGRVRVSLFNERISDALLSQSATLPARVAVGDLGLYSYVQNVDRTRVNGIELVVERRNVFVPGFDLGGSATWVDPMIAADAAFPAAVGKQITGVPRFKATVAATWRPTDRWSWTVAGRYSDRQYATLDNSDVVTHTYQGFDPFFVVDTRVSYRIDSRWEAAIGVDNVGDERYILFHPFPGRTIQAELNYRF